MRVMWLAALALALALAACGDDAPPPADAGSPPDGSGFDSGPPTNARVVVDLVHAPNPDLLSLAIRGEDAKLVGDRGELLAPRVHDVGDLTVLADPQARLTFVNVLPATYSRFDLELHGEREKGETRLAFELELMRGAEVVAVRTTEEAHLETRCAEGIFVGPDADERFVESFDLEVFRGVLDTVTLPAPAGGRIEVDETTVGSDDMEAIRRAFERAWSLDCQPAGM
jgi:hypothetical protein